MRKVILDIEANGLDPYKVTQVWVIVCRDVDSQEVHIFREVTHDPVAKAAFLRYAEGVRTFIGHNWLGYDYIVLHRLLDLNIPNLADKSFDTLIVSKLLDYSRKSHSLEAWGETLGLSKKVFTDFSRYSKEMEEYCVRDVEVNTRLYHHLWNNCKSWISNALALEQEFQLICNDLHRVGFGFDVDRATKLLEKVLKDLGELDEVIRESFPPRLKAIREVTPSYTRFGTLNRKDFRWVEDNDLSVFNGGPFTRCEWKEFNPSSHRQLIDVLSEAGWRPTDKTETHKDAQREYQRSGKKSDLVDLEEKLKVLSKTGWKINEENLSTLPKSAPEGARSLAKRILLESRRRTLTEWLSLVCDDGRIHGKFYGIGAWTHRMAHQEPNTANIPREFKEDGSSKLLGKELRSLWIASPKKKRLLVGVDAEGIQLRIFAHYIDDPEFTDALVRGRKDDKSDPHSLNQRVLGSICKTRQAAKRFIYALLLGGGINKLAEILGASKEATQEALDRLLERYTGFARMRKEVFPRDARRGYFIGLDGRQVRIPGETQRDREHLAMSGYLQNGEVIVVKKAALISSRNIRACEGLETWSFVDIVHDELQNEVDNDLNRAIMVAKIEANAIVEAGEYYDLKCPLAGSYMNDHGDFTIGTNWYQTH